MQLFLIASTPVFPMAIGSAEIGTVSFDSNRTQVEKRENKKYFGKEVVGQTGIPNQFPPSHCAAFLLPEKKFLTEGVSGASCSKGPRECPSRMIGERAMID